MDAFLQMKYDMEPPVGVIWVETVLWIKSLWGVQRVLCSVTCPTLLHIMCVCSLSSSLAFSLQHKISVTTLGLFSSKLHLTSLCFIFLIYRTGGQYWIVEIWWAMDEFILRINIDLGNCLKWRKLYNTCWHLCCWLPSHLLAWSPCPPLPGPGCSS